MKAKLLISALAASALLLTTGCVNNVSNLTPENLPQNTSGIYTITCNGKVTESDALPKTVKCSIVIDGTVRPMQRSAFSKDVYTYDYTIPTGQNQARYYFLLEYDVRNKGVVTHRERKSPLQTLYLANRYVMSIESDRGLVGAKISVVGRGFSRQDKIVLGGVEAPTQFSSPNVISFTVPAIAANQDYYVELRTSGGNLPVGKFRVDPSVLKVTPGEIHLNAGKNGTVVFSTEFEAPEGGLPIEILTNAPDSLVMPPVVIPAGKRSVSVKVQGGQAGSGLINISAPGFNPMQIPLNVVP